MEVSPSSPQGVDGSGRAPRVLVVDDDADSAELLATVLGRAGYEPRLASNGRGALTAAAEFLPQIALIDIGLPDMDGFRLAKLLRAQPELGSCRLIAVTGHTSPSAVARSIAAGFEAHFGKPLNMADLLSAIAQQG